MSIINRNLTRRMLNALYMLKREYGGSIDIYRRLGGNTDHLTGVVTVEKSVIQVKRAIILPAKVLRTNDIPLNVISANKFFTLGGTYDRHSRLFIIDRRDVPNLDLKSFELTIDDWIVYNGLKYQIKSFEIMEFDAAWAITGQAVIGDTPEQIFPSTGDDLLRLTQSAVLEP